MGRHPVAVVNLHITYARIMRVDYSGFSWGGLHGKHVVATWKGKTGTIPAFALGPRKTKKTCVEIAGRRNFGLLTSSQPSGIKVRSSPASSKDNR
jgi:hypothetical protein